MQSNNEDYTVKKLNAIHSVRLLLVYKLLYVSIIKSKARV